MAEINIEKMAQDISKKVMQELRDNGVFVGRWIPVSERLPEDWEYVLLTVRRMKDAYNHLPFISVGFISWNQQSWWCAHDGDCAENHVEVLAWMPLPLCYVPQESEGEE